MPQKAAVNEPTLASVITQRNETDTQRQDWQLDNGPKISSSHPEYEAWGRRGREREREKEKKRSVWLHKRI